jgi:polyisoprenoid-binding protein YceI
MTRVRRPLSFALSPVLTALIVGGAAGPSPLRAQPPLPTRFNIDASHSSVGFVVRFMGLSTVRGAFAGVAGTVMYADGAPERSSVSVVIDVGSINTNSRTRDDHLRSPDFFDAARYPTITFRSNRVTRAGAGAGFAARGTLVLRGVAREVDVPFVQLNPPVKDAWGNSRVTFQGGLRISRKAYGVLGTAFWNGEFDPGRMAVADSVDIELLVSANVPNPERWTHPVGDSLYRSVTADGLDETLRRFRRLYAGNPRVDSIPEFAFLVVGQRLAWSGRARDAARFYETILDARPGATTARLSLGEAYVKLGALDRARREFERVAREAPESTAAPEWLRALPAP